MTVRQKQWQLWLLGYYDGAIDGIWGSLSAEATKDLQRTYGMAVDGIFGPATEALTVDILTQLQKALTDGTMAIDGLAGMETASAVAAWQTARNKEATGRADMQTLQLILAVAEDKMPTKETWWDGIRYFSRSEFRCKCGRYCDGFPAEPHRVLVEAAEQVREHFGGPVYVSSGVRCARHNAAVGGVDGSRHKSGKAMDFRVEGQNANTVLSFVKTLPAIRYAYAIDGSYVHMDVA
ncbi:MAG: peptidoglycan-binding protein [Oscillospiraceae bacterium]|nr:peptidoglycan-binding protein [Oscillospiraceae bacterium]